MTHVAGWGLNDRNELACDSGFDLHKLDPAQLSYRQIYEVEYLDRDFSDASHLMRRCGPKELNNLNGKGYIRAGFGDTVRAKANLYIFRRGTP